MLRPSHAPLPWVVFLGVCWCGVQPARASNPLEYPDNGSASFSRGGAWLAVANEPIAAHYDPAGLALQESGVSVEQQLAFPHTCFDRRGATGGVTGPNGDDVYQYREACSARGSFPNTIPSIALAWRASDRVGVGFAVVPPATYGTADNQFPSLANGFDTAANQATPLPASYRYQQLGQRSTILFPTLSVGVALGRNVRVGAGFIAGMGVIDLTTAAVNNLGSSDAAGDHMGDDSLSTLRTKDLFIPGVVLALHVSPAPDLDLALWGRYVDALRSSTGSLDVTQRPFDSEGRLSPPCAGAPGANGTTYEGCTAAQAVPNHFPGALTRFVYPIPPEIRLGVRFHRPRSRHGEWDAARAVRDPLHDDLFDVELDQSLTLSSLAKTIEARFQEKDGTGTLLTKPTSVPVPPNADRPTGYRDSYGARLGAQWNAVRDLFGVRVGGWVESRSQDPTLLTVAPVGAARFGFGGGVVFRYHFLDVSLGYQRQLSAGLDNHGKGRLRAPTATGSGSGFDLRDEPAGVDAADRTQFRTIHAVNGGSVTFDAHVFTLGFVARL